MNLSDSWKEGVGYIFSELWYFSWKYAHLTWSHNCVETTLVWPISGLINVSLSYIFILQALGSWAEYVNNAPLQFHNWEIMYMSYLRT